MEENQDLLYALPSAVLAHMVSFLSSNDALQLSELNSSFQSALSFSVLHDPTPISFPRTLYGTRNEESNTPRRKAWIPVLFPHRTHSVVLTCKWRDQGFGNQKGALFVVAVPSQDDPNEAALESIENGAIVYQSPLAPHQEESLTFSFSSSPDKAYYLWYRIGGGGGHQLRVRNLKMHTIIYDCNEDQWIGRHYQKLNSQGFLSNPNDFSLATLRTLASVGREELTPEISRHLDSHFGSNGFDTSADSMKALEELATALLEIKAKKLAHEPLEPPRENHRGGRHAVGRVVIRQVEPNQRLDEFLQGAEANIVPPQDGEVPFNDIEAQVLAAMNDLARIGNFFGEALPNDAPNDDDDANDEEDEESL